MKNSVLVLFLIISTGLSLGGEGTWYLAAKYPGQELYDWLLQQQKSVKLN